MFVCDEISYYISFEYLGMWCLFSGSADASQFMFYLKCKRLLFWKMLLIRFQYEMLFRIKLMYSIHTFFSPHLLYTEYTQAFIRSIRIENMCIMFACFMANLFYLMRFPYDTCRYCRYHYTIALDRTLTIFSTALKR